MTSPVWLYVGCYTTASTTGIHVFDAAATDGTVVATSRIDDIDHASFLAVHPDLSMLYAVSETPEHGSVVAYRRDRADGSLRRYDAVPSHGASPCHLSTDGTAVHVVNYTSGTVATYALDADGGFGQPRPPHQHEGTGPHPRQGGPHTHSVIIHDASVYVTDLGTDRIVRYVAPTPTDDAGAAALAVADHTVLPPGSGPRHLAFHPERREAYVVCELTNRLVVLDVDDSGTLQVRDAVSTLPHDASGESIAAEVAVHPDGHRVYVSNRGHDSIATFAIDDPATAPVLLAHVASGGRTPRHFAIHPSGRSLLVANQDSDTLVAFALDTDGLPHDGVVVATVSQPVCVCFVEVEP